MSKRSHGEGTIYQRKDGKWQAQVSVNGKRLSYTHKNRQKVDAWRKAMTRQVEHGLTYQGARESLGEYLERWLATKKGSLRPATLDNYTLNIRKYILPELGDLPLKDLTPDRVQFVWDTYLQDGVGAPTLRKVHDILHAALARAVKTGLAYRNVLDAVEKPAANQEEMKIWTEAEVSRFLDTARSNRLYALFYLAVVTGARQMELCGLQWADLDWGRRTLHIRRQLARKGEMYAPQKTRAAKRTLSLGEATIDVLQAHLERQAQERALAGSGWQEHDLIFTSTTGTPVHHKNLYDRYFKPLVEKSGVTDIRFHDLRHTAASIMLSHGRPPIVVSRILGHARVSITLDIYGHLVPGMDAGAIELMEGLVTPDVLAVEDIL
jgi:integrase